MVLTKGRYELTCYAVLQVLIVPLYQVLNRQNALCLSKGKRMRFYVKSYTKVVQQMQKIDFPTEYLNLQYKDCSKLGEDRKNFSV